MEQKRKFDDTISWKYGEIVWGKYEKNCIWPAIIINPRDGGYETAKEEHYWLFWYGDGRATMINKSSIFNFSENFNQIYKKYKRNSKSWKTGVLTAIRDYGYPESNDWSDDQLLSWALDGFCPISCDFKYINRIPDHIMQILKDKKQFNEKHNLDMSVKKRAPPDIQKTLNDLKRSDKAPPDTDICFGCYEHQATEKHPIFEASLCINCKENYKLTVHSYGDDGVMYYCTVCGCAGDTTIVCSDEKCGRVYCTICLEDFTNMSIKQLLKIEEWKCFVCEPTNSKSGLLKVNSSNWKENIRDMFCTSGIQIVEQPKLPKFKKRIRVLSLFDGIGTGLYVLKKKLNLDVEHYYTCEIDKGAINIVDVNFKNENITNLGDVRNLDEKLIKQILPIDLLIGGSPCNDLSLANPARKGLYDTNGSGILFFEFYRILMILRKYNNFFWLFENVASMRSAYKEIISRFLQCEPVLIDSVWVSAQHRPRLFWGNLLSLEDTLIEGDGPELQQFLFPKRIAVVKKLRTITTNKYSLMQEVGSPVKDKNLQPDNLWITELELVFGFEEHYTDIGNISLNKRHILLGRAWSVQTITHLLRFLQNYFV